MTKYRPDDGEYRRLVQLITQWNDDHYDIFEITQPNEVSVLIYSLML